MTKAEVAKLVAVMAAAFPNAKITPDTSAVYERMLADLDYPAANAAVERLLATCKFLPTVAEIRECALTVETGEVRPGGDAWGDVLRAVSRFGIYRTPWFEDPVVEQCVSALSWREICNSENQSADRARFIELYDRLAATSRRKQLSDGLPAMQRYRELENKRQQAVAAGGGPGAMTIGKLIPLVLGSGDADD